jgi:two-component system response regulator GlrR
MLRVLDQVSQAAKSDAVVFIKGESGTGKELVAKSLHVAGSRKNGPFVAINCAAIPETLLESELFGYETGAFTGADRSKQGLFARAHRGTLFLDEISEMSLTMQAKILRVLENMEFYPLGSGKTVRVDARVITASNRDLEEEVRKGRFRNDLFYRIHVITIELPPLRERKSDIPLLARYFLKKLATKMNKDVVAFSPSALQKLMSHDWPGNVRELENTIESAVAMTVRNIIADELILPSKTSLPGPLKHFKDAKQDFERDYLLQLIELTRGNVSQAAKLAGKHRADLYELLKKYDLDPASFRDKEPVGGN